VAKRRTRKEVAEIHTAILQAISVPQQDHLVAGIGERFGLGPKAVHHHITALRNQGLLQVTGSRRVPKYELVPLRYVFQAVPITPESAEHDLWRAIVAPVLDAGPIPSNIREICEYGISEMVNNAIDHSESPTVAIGAKVTAADVTLVVSDQGVGIFNKIQRDCRLADPREAVLELAKGKLTTAPDAHTGEGIFFTSRMFDRFYILSGKLTLLSEDGQDWLFDDIDHGAMTGTFVQLQIGLSSTRTKAEIFARFSDPDGITFSRTHVPVALGQYPGDSLVSRSQARRIVARFERFREVWLDFKGVETIGPAFADEIFRVFQSEHPNLHLWHIHTTPAIEAMISKARGVSVEPQPGAP
jgi:anti-sigma regulatory factor (Ser/Thr protein kinase)